MIAANAVGNPLQSRTRQKISQVWLASQTGPMAWSMSARGRAPRSALGAAGGEVPQAGAEVGATEYAVEDDAGQQHAGDDRSHALS
ncbi:MAG: hypothetical protein ACTHMS_10275 [Jatrophihabitans sp.]|uniref:hypothetical protein n=1 Tax=Jatrophihabitans sp. TaxID=1932789 RepID=UPI003F7D9E58